MATPNYQFEKRQRDLAKKNKQEEKRRNKLAGKMAASQSEAAPAESDGVAAVLPDDTPALTA